MRKLTIFLAILATIFSGCISEQADETAPPIPQSILMADCDVYSVGATASTNGGRKISGWSNQKALPTSESKFISITECARVSVGQQVFHKEQFIIFSRLNQVPSEGCLEVASTLPETLQEILVESPQLQEALTNKLEFEVSLGEISIDFSGTQVREVSWTTDGKTSFAPQLANVGNPYAASIKSSLFWQTPSGLAQMELAFTGTDFTPHFQFGNAEVHWPENMMEDSQWLAQFDYSLDSGVTSSLHFYGGPDCGELKSQLTP